MFQAVHYVFDYQQICDFPCSSLFHVVALCATIGVVTGVVILRFMALFVVQII